MGKLILAVVVMAFMGSSYAKSCKDFATQAEAQAYFKTHNAKNLDRDNDGIACENGAGGKKSSKKGKDKIKKVTTASKSATTYPAQVGKLPGQK